MASGAPELEAFETPVPWVMVHVFAVLLPVVADAPNVQLNVEPIPRNPPPTVKVTESDCRRLLPTDVVVPFVVPATNPLELLLPGAA